MISYVSASQITTFRDCPRKWYFNKIVGIETPSTAATELGSAVHAALEDYLVAGGELPDSEAGQIAASGLHLLPRGRVEVEVSLADMPLRDSPVDVVGFVDAIYPDAHHLLDHKTSSNQRYTKTPRELKQNIQLLLYARAYLDRCDAEKVTLTHVYYGTRSRWSKRVDVEVSREWVLERWEEIKREIKHMMTTSDAATARDVAPNREACDKYGGCPFRAQCFRAASYTPQKTNTTQREKRETQMKQTPEQRMLELGLALPPKRNLPFDIAPQQRPTPLPAHTDTKTLYVGCFPTKGGEAPINVLDAYSDAIRALCESFRVPHLSLVDYAKGWSALAGAILEAGWAADGAMFIDIESRECEHLLSSLSQLADVVIRRL